MPFVCTAAVVKLGNGLELQLNKISKIRIGTHTRLLRSVPTNIMIIDQEILVILLEVRSLHYRAQCLYSIFSVMALHDTIIGSQYHTIDKRHPLSLSWKAQTIITVPRINDCLKVERQPFSLAFIREHVCMPVCIPPPAEFAEEQRNFAFVDACHSFGFSGRAPPQQCKRSGGE